MVGIAGTNLEINKDGFVGGEVIERKLKWVGLPKEGGIFAQNREGCAVNLLDKAIVIIVEVEDIQFAVAIAVGAGLIGHSMPSSKPSPSVSGLSALEKRVAPV